jgi:hypothetical protein
MALPFRRGTWCGAIFPYAENPDRPALGRHAAIVMGVSSRRVDDSVHAGDASA